MLLIINFFKVFNWTASNTKPSKAVSFNVVKFQDVNVKFKKIVSELFMSIAISGKYFLST
jgi:hypothetical protein